MNIVVMWLLLPVCVATAVAVTYWIDKKTDDIWLALGGFMVVFTLYLGIFMACVWYNIHQEDQYWKARYEAYRLEEAKHVRTVEKKDD